MSSKPPPPTAEATTDKPKKPGKAKLIMIAAPVVLLLVVAGLWFSGILPHMLGMDRHEEHQASAEPAKAAPPSYVDIPEMVANLNNNSHKPSYIKLSVRVEVPKPEDTEKIKAALPRLQDIIQTYLREMRPEELRGSAGTYRLREELLIRANTAVAPAKVIDVLFTQLLVQ
jgi:flagellar FliL protein